MKDKIECIRLGVPVLLDGEELSKRELARTLGISRSSLYYRHKRPIADEALRQKIELLMLCHPTYGHRRIADALEVNRKRVWRVMKLFFLRPNKKAAPTTITNELQSSSVRCPDITSVLSPIAPGVIWECECSFLNIQSQFVYVVAVLDYFTAELLEFSIATEKSMSELIFITVGDALRKQGSPPTWFHLQTGGAFVSRELLTHLSQHNISVSSTDKVVRESFFGGLKREFGDASRFQTQEELTEALRGFNAHYSQQRIHGRLGMTPAAFRASWETRTVASSLIVRTINKDSLQNIDREA